jgi:uncharacterized membrane protein
MIQKSKRWLWLSALLSSYAVCAFIYTLYRIQTEIVIDGQQQYSRFASNLAICAVLIVSVWASLYVAHRIKDKNQAEGKFYSKGKVFIFSSLVFICIAFLLPFPLIDARTSDGAVAIVNFEFFGYMFVTIPHLILVAIASLFV